MTVFGGDPVYAEDVNDITPDAFTSFSSTPIQPLVSAASTDTLITSVAVDFEAGFAYEITYGWRAQFTGGTSPFQAYAKIRRLNAAGTVIHDPGGTACITTNFVSIDGRCYVECTTADTTQTIALIGGFGSSGSPTSVDVEASSTARTYLVVKKCGIAGEYAALEVPTA
jgi:hypothetical protein